MAVAVRRKSAIISQTVWAAPYLGRQSRHHRVTQHKESWTQGEGKKATARRCLARDRLTSSVHLVVEVRLVIHIWIHDGSPESSRRGPQTS
jgi:hypothetical protein